MCVNVCDLYSYRPFLHLVHVQAQFYSPESFQRFNMFNSFFYSSNGEEVCRRFLSHAADRRTAIVVDPPFGGLAKVLANGIKNLWDMAKEG